MRRNRNMGRGGGGGGNLNMSGGPLLTEHLKDIDLELELLKRKREMIEKQQFLQPFSQQSQRNYTQQSYSYNQHEPKHSSTNDFSHLYNDGPQQYRKPFGKRRQTDNSDWHNDYFPKRSAGQGSRAPSGPGPSANRNPRPYSGPSHQKNPVKQGGKQSIGQKIANQKNPKPDKRFLTNNKVTKPTKAYVPPNKIASQPVAARKDLVASALKSVAESESRERGEREALRLLPDQVPTKQMTGRMELALGSILRDVREKYTGTQHEDLLRPSNIQRVIKQDIRDRIRNTMLGKIVGTSPEIITEYRNKYPKETDMEIVNHALVEAGVAQAKQTKVTESKIVAEKPMPIDFYKQNLIKLMNSHLREMFDKIDELYNPPATGTAGVDSKADNVEPAKQENTEANIKSEETPEPEAETPKADSAEILNPQPAETSKPESSEAPQPDPARPEDVLANLQSHEYKRMLPRLLKRHIPTIIKLLNVNKMYQGAIADLRTKTREIYMEYGKNMEPNQPAPTPAIEYLPAMPPKHHSPYNFLPYHVKVMGKPQLPKKKVMHTFLEVFNPKSIKKHRSIHNLLFIGFSEKEDFDGIVKADGTVIGRSTLSIRVCDKTPGKPDDKVVATNGKNDSTDDIIGSELDGQITDLLSTIRKTEEQMSQDEGSETENNGAEAVGENIVTQEHKETEDVPEQNETTQEITEEDNAAQEDTAFNIIQEESVKVSNGDANNTDQVQPEIATPETESKPEVDTAENDAPAEAEAHEQNTDVDQVSNGEINDQVAELKNSVTGKSTPTRSSSRLGNAPVTPSSIRTRRASRLQN